MTDAPDASLQGKTFLVTGGGRGLGAAICQNLSAAGASLVVADVDETLARNCAEKLDASGERAYSLSFDVAEPAAVRSAFEQVRERSGRLDGIVNNAAIDITLPVDEVETERWHRVLMVNLYGPYLMSHAVVPMKTLTSPSLPKLEPRTVRL